MRKRSSGVDDDLDDLQVPDLDIDDVDEVVDEELLKPAPKKSPKAKPRRSSVGPQCPQCGSRLTRDDNEDMWWYCKPCRCYYPRAHFAKKRRGR